MYKPSICKHLNDADRLEIIEIRRITDDYMYYWCPLCKRMGKLIKPANFNKWEYWRLMQLLKTAFKNARSTSNKCFIENVIRLCEYFYDQVPMNTVQFTSVVEEHVAD